VPQTGLPIVNTRASFTVDRTGARLAVVTPFETVCCVVDIEVGNFECARGPPQAFELAWTRDGPRAASGCSRSPNSAWGRWSCGKAGSSGDRRR
jgi:hypothetical protein